MKPNIFEIATKELSQDAFITWLLKWADDSCKNLDEDLHQCGKEFVSALIKKQNPNFSEFINKVEAGRQWENIDVWAEINDKYFIIIEDKTNSKEHSKQLEKYKNFEEEWRVKNNKEKAVCIYLKTGNESKENFKDIEKKGYSVFERKDFLSLFEKFPNIKNDIFVDFKERILQIEEITNSYKNKKISEWKYFEWQGLYQVIEEKMGIGNWEYQKAMGRFWKYWFNIDGRAGDYPLYIQLEQNKLCFKISTDPKDVEFPEDKTRGQVRNDFYFKLIEKAQQKGYDEIRKPSKFGNGDHMTFAIVEQKDWLGEDIVDVDKVVENLKKYLEFLREFVKEYNKK